MADPLLSVDNSSTPFASIVTRMSKSAAALARERAPQPTPQQQPQSQVQSPQRPVERLFTRTHSAAAAQTDTASRVKSAAVTPASMAFLQKDRGAFVVSVVAMWLLKDR